MQQLRTALGQLEGEIPAGTSKARQNLEQVHKSLQLLQAQMHHKVRMMDGGGGCSCRANMGKERSAVAQIEGSLTT